MFFVFLFVFLLLLLLLPGFTSVIFGEILDQGGVDGLQPRFYDVLNTIKSYLM